MTGRLRGLVFAAVVLLVLGATTAYAARDLGRYRDRVDSAPPVAETAMEGLLDGPHIVFRNTALSEDYGRVGVVSLDDPGGARALADQSCDRIDATAVAASCLVRTRGVVNAFAWLDLDAEFREVARSPMTGLPSRTRLSPDSTLVASTVFVAGHSYLQTGFSTATVIRRVGGASEGNLERFTLVLDGREVRPADRNVWGVTFLDDRTFYATVATGGTPYLVRGDLRARTLTALRPGVECPSLSPDGTRLAFKSATSKAGVASWRVGVLDLATDEVRILAGETHSVDDQIGWLDDDTVMYGLPRDGEPGVTDVWALDVRPDAAPRVLVPSAWSPSVVRTGTAS